MNEKIERDHLFISYAIEDSALAEWLTLKLTNEGYLVWCDKIQLFGGESYPRDIDIAIRKKTYRFIALLSKYSINKPNPRRERTLAFKLGDERKEDFLIPINVDGMKSTELDWMTIDRTYISFYNNWREGLQQLLNKLSLVNTPKFLINGKNNVAAYFLERSFIKHEKETLCTNCLNIIQIPKRIMKYKINAKISNYSLLKFSL